MSAQSSRRIGLACLLGSIVFSAFGQLGMKAGMQQLHGLVASHATATPAFDWTSSLPAAAWTAAGLVSYGLSLLAWLVVLIRYPLSYAYPLLGMSYVLVYVGATQWPALQEPATTLRTVGTLLIIGGIALVSMTNDRASSTR
jgi:undecaprenyl phosphate-alpha-L-ara4N flippase subunit ArnF